ncbi:CBS domain-containing protein [Amycolatopsis aidingensis]|uniref:CBS domain-containing protein n=1 Tax=Amycolatopsis aidingensis TaxID=2842453 RepID=UPI001E5BC495|nr:CBS domain-containing protein [Amycolatopsis aidingensis]
MRDLTVADLMTTPAFAVGPETEFTEIVRLLATHRISALPVVDADGRPVGVVSEADLLAKEEYAGAGARSSPFGRHRDRERRRKARAHTAADLMTAPVHAVPAGTPLPEAARMLARSGLRRLFVLRGDVLAGVLARRDLIAVFLRSDEQLGADVRREVFERALGVDPLSVGVSVRHGAVTLLGRLGSKAEVRTAGRLTELVPGVVGVRNRLDYVWGESAGRRHW